MIDPEDLNATLAAYVDGELDNETAIAVERMIASDPRVRADVEMFRHTATLLRSACGERHYDRAPERAAAPLRPQAHLRRRRAAVAMAAGIVLALGGFGTGVWWQDGGDHGLLGEIAEYHAVISKETTHLAEVPAERADEFTDWMGRRLGRHLSVPDLEAAGLRFSGGRMLIIDSKPVADFLYTRTDGPPVAVCVARGEIASSGLRVVERGGLRLAAWTDAGFTYVIVGELDAAAARRIAGLVAPQIAA